MKKVKAKLQVRHYPQVPCKPFCVNVEDEVEAKKVIDILAHQHLFLFDQDIIPDYSNVILVVMWDEGRGEWEDYWNDEEMMEWREFEDTYFDHDTTLNLIKYGD